VFVIQRFVLAAFVVAAAAAPGYARQASDPPEIRALWVDAFHAGIRSPQEADDLVAAATRVNLNTLFVQVRRRGDALYTRGVEPPLDDPAYDPGFDALAYIVDAGHRAGLQVHAWVNAMPTWREQTPPRDARHIFNRHGPSAPGDDNWFTASPTGSHRFPVGYFVDPGHPAAAAYLTEVYLNIVRNYAIDGIHFDYIRYPETDADLPGSRAARGAGVGYNAVNLRRFNRATARSGSGPPEPGDEAWIVWRRQQVTHLVRRIAVEAKAINPRIRISAALIPWGRPPVSEKDFADVAPMQRIFQNWHQWMEDGLIDLAVPMNYAAETNDRNRGWFDGWIRWEKQHRHGRQLAVGLGAYLNTPDDLLRQIARVRRPEEGERANGVSIFSYAVPQIPPKEPSAPGSDRLAFLGAAFRLPAPVPPMPWIDTPTTGWIAGTVTAVSPEQADGATIKIRRAGFSLFRRTRRIEADGNGYFALTSVRPGRYRVWVDSRSKSEVIVQPGRVARADVMLR
jgi:uncharacterized lipoprotein YddW (UPF0748 family)